LPNRDPPADLQNAAARRRLPLPDHSAAVDGYRMSCEAASTARVTVPASAFDTFVMLCDAGFRRFTRRRAPDVRLTVLHQCVSRTDGAFEARPLDIPE